jgi:hypothetical protein
MFTLKNLFAGDMPISRYEMMSCFFMSALARASSSVRQFWDPG